jgi:hypothetical protein
LVDTRQNLPLTRQRSPLGSPRHGATALENQAIKHWPEACSVNAHG